MEGLIYAGTDDGLVQVTEDGGASWLRMDSFPGIPERTYVSDVTASRHDPDTVYALFNNPQVRRLRPLRAAEPRSRPELDGHQRRPAGRSRHLVDRGGSRGTRAALPRHRVRLFFSRTTGRAGSNCVAACRRWPSATSRFNVARATSSERLRARLLRHRRLLAVARRERRAAGPGGAPLPRRDKLRLHRVEASRVRRDGRPGRRLLHGPQPAVRRGVHLPPERRAHVVAGRAARA